MQSTQLPSVSFCQTLKQRWVQGRMDAEHRPRSRQELVPNHCRSAEQPTKPQWLFCVTHGCYTCGMASRDLDRPSQPQPRLSSEIRQSRHRMRLISPDRSADVNVLPARRARITSRVPRSLEPELRLEALGRTVMSLSEVQLILVHSKEQVRGNIDCNRTNERRYAFRASTRFAPQAVGGWTWQPQNTRQQ